MVSECLRNIPEKRSTWRRLHQGATLAAKLAQSGMPRPVQPLCWLKLAKKRSFTITVKQWSKRLNPCLNMLKHQVPESFCPLSLHDLAIELWGRSEAELPTEWSYHNQREKWWKRCAMPKIRILWRSTSRFWNTFIMPKIIKNLCFPYFWNLLARPEANYRCFLEASYLTSQQKPAVNGAGILLIIHYQLPNCQKINAKPRCHWDTFSWKFRRPYPARKSGHFYVVPRWCPGRCLLPPVLAPKLMPDWPYNSQWWPRRRRWRPGWRSADRNVLGFREKKKDGNLWENQLNTTPWILQETEGLSPKRSWNLGTSQSWLFLRGVI